MKILLACLFLIACDGNNQPSQVDVPDVQNDNSTGETAVTLGCISDRRCASDNDCDQGERCNLTLPVPACQFLYCSGVDQPCDHTSGDALCMKPLICVGTDVPVCQACDCDDGNALTDDTCNGKTGECEHTRFGWLDTASGLV